MHRSGNAVFVDGHVHKHACFDTETFLNGASRNIQRAASGLGVSGPNDNFLLMTESNGMSFFTDVASHADRGGIGRWAFATTEEETSLIAIKGAERLIIIAGRQIATRERLEVLAIGTVETPPDGDSLQNSLGATRAAGAMAIIPWGFGKWWGTRGTFVAHAINTALPGQLHLGDNGGRLRRSRPPKHFAMAENRGLSILPGSDPLPFPEHNDVAGSYGLFLHGPINPDRPTASICALINDREVRRRPFGTRTSFSKFIRYQMAMQLRKRRL